MTVPFASSTDFCAKLLFRLAALAVVFIMLAPSAAHSLPLFARQTGQNCLACHAGGQFPELTPYGRMFKMTGYTIGERTVPLSAMVLGSYSKVADTSKSDDPSADFSKNGSLIFATASVFLGGKITDNIGAFAQVTYDPYSVQNSDGSYAGHTNADNIDIRYADRFIDGKNDFIFGVSANNNPSVTDPWNTAAAWMQYVPVPSPSSSQFIDGNTPYPTFASGGNIAGLTAYGFWNQMIYGEIGAYGTSTGLFRFMSAGLDSSSSCTSNCVTQLKGLNPYARLAISREWGASNLMVGAAGMVSQVYDFDPSETTHYRDLLVDAQYQYLLDPHTVTAQMAYGWHRVSYPASVADQPAVDASGNPVANTSSSDTSNVFRAKVTYVYQAKYGGSVNFFNQTSSTNTYYLNSARVNGNVTGNLGQRGATLEAFWTPIQYVRLGVQYTAYNRYNGASTNYDGAGRNASDNNSLFLYIWGAY
jgi:hypothetical protein